jgi:hypothetical protein
VAPKTQLSDMTGALSLQSGRVEKASQCAQPGLEPWTSRAPGPAHVWVILLWAGLQFSSTGRDI